MPLHALFCMQGSSGGRDSSTRVHGSAVENQKGWGHDVPESCSPALRHSPGGSLLSDLLPDNPAKVGLGLKPNRGNRANKRERRRRIFHNLVGQVQENPH